MAPRGPRGMAWAAQGSCQPGPVSYQLCDVREVHCSCSLSPSVLQPEWPFQGTNQIIPRPGTGEKPGPDTETASLSGLWHWGCSGQRARDQAGPHSTLLTMAVRTALKGEAPISPRTGGLPIHYLSHSSFSQGHKLPDRVCHLGRGPGVGQLGWASFICSHLTHYITMPYMCTILYFKNTRLFLAYPLPSTTGASRM